MAVRCDPESFIFQRIFNHACLGLADNIGHAHEANLIERAGDLGLDVAYWPITGFPRLIYRGLSDPRIITIVLTALALGAVSFAFYPAVALPLLEMAIASIPLPPLWAIKFAAYLNTCVLIFFTGVRAEGRFCNDALMQRFYIRRAGGAH